MDTVKDLMQVLSTLPPDMRILRGEPFIGNVYFPVDIKAKPMVLPVRSTTTIIIEGEEPIEAYVDASDNDAGAFQAVIL